MEQMPLTLMTSPSNEKVCPICKVSKPLRDFPIRSCVTPRPNAYCKPCQRLYSRDHYRRNAKAHNQRRMANQRRYLVRNSALMVDYLIGRSCVDCGEGDPTVLEFDHVRGRKSFDVSTMVRGGFSWQRILLEIAKCELRCANCHRRQTAARFWKHRRIDGR